ncbi:MAG: prepilin-type N-terminal cleavage/methylation domain-containing protein [Candidatus Sumerlaeaceae bacterium]|nr:prepilin-type N-terminal cleavage/methylation domain-containing protein [Candidatus Sumerlaeaceae bacterium]
MPHKGAFTLIELLIVVAIISILALIAIPNLSLAKRRANQAKCASNLKAIAYALYAYRLDLDHYPLADGTAGEMESMGQTNPGSGPAANGSWDGVPRVLVNRRYLTSEEYLFCPTHRDNFKGDRLQKFRYAYNNSAADTGGVTGAPNNVERDSHDIWFCRCLWVPVDKSFNPAATDAIYPHGEQQDRENTLFSNSRVELRDGRADFLAAHP